MKKILILLIVFGFALTVYSKDLKFQDFYNGGLTAFKDGDVKLATYFFEEAEKMARADSVFKGYVWNVRFRDANYLIGKYEQAKEFGEKCIAISKAGLGENNPGLHYDYKLLAFICAENKDYDSARCYIDSIDMVLPPRSNEREFQYDKAISKGVIYSKMKDWSTAESYLEPARMRSQRFPLSDDSRKSLNLLGEACFQNNDYDSALYAFMDLRRINERNFGRNSREYQRANYQVGKMLMYIGDYMESEWIFKEVLDWYQERLPQQLKTLQASDRIDYIEDLNEIMPNIVLFGFAAGHYDDYFTSLVYDQLFLPRYALRAPEKYSEAVIKEMGNEQDVKAFNIRKELKNQLSRLLSDPGSNPDEALQTYSDIKNIERTLDFAGYKDYGNKSFSPIGYEDIKNKLKDDEILLDFADFEPKGTTRQYVCYEIRNNQNYPKVHLICTGPQVEALLTEVREGNLSANSKGSENDILIGSRLKGIIGNASTVYYIPSGVFHNISIEGLSDGEKSLSDSFSFRRLSSSIDLYEE